uniref:Cyclin-like domain-containing protein n=1 Tax=Pseudodiaptomus poplesia TaxID=213370 RepID=A0A0U2T5G7_9MAXI|nr:hypothetical protein [Pseudodiaptomus poplesia]
MKKKLDFDYIRQEDILNSLSWDSPEDSEFADCDEVWSDLRNSESAVVEWMREVANHENLGGKIYLLAVSYFYRFLSKTCLQKKQLQLLASSCLLLSSKMGGQKPLSVQQLIESTNFNFDRRELIDMEMLVLSSLCWDVYCHIDGNEPDIHTQCDQVESESSSPAQLQQFNGLQIADFKL